MMSDTWLQVVISHAVDVARCDLLFLFFFLHLIEAIES